MERKNILSYSDLAIRRGMMMLYHHKDLDKERFMKYKKRYSPYGSIASLYLWEISSGKYNL
jgi:DNA-3-methyladenine glycosylase II